MPSGTGQKDLNLKALELFEICARKGSLQATAKETGLSVSTVSHHLKNLEEHLGVDLFDHSRRPMTLTLKGQIFLRNIGDALYTIRSAKAEASSGIASEASYLRIGTIEDFDSDIIPELAVILSSKMPNCDFLYHTDSSHAILEMLRDRKLDLGIMSNQNDRLSDLQDRPLLRDPFVVVLPGDSKLTPQEVVKGKSDLPFLRFSSAMMIGKQIEAQLRRLGLSLPSSFECGNNQTLMAMVAASAGWTVTTPLLYSRAKRFQPDIQMHPFPGKSFARKLSIVASQDCSNSVVELLDGKMRALISQHITKPIHENYPWLQESFKLIE